MVELENDSAAESAQADNACVIGLIHIETDGLAESLGGLVEIGYIHPLTCRGQVFDYLGRELTCEAHCANAETDDGQ